MFNKVDTEVIESLKKISGSDNVFYDNENLDLYSRDYTENLSFYPEVIVKPATAQEVSEILILANKNLIPVVPRGGGTGLSGGALPLYGGICLSMEKFRKIIEIDSENCQATAEPGVITQVFQEKCEEHGLYYPPDPSSRGSSFLGGNLAECAGGPRAVKYGVTKDYVLALEAVLPTGEIINTGAKVLKNVSGYNLTQLLIGSEGTLGIITKIYFKLISLPKFRKVILVAFNSIEDSAKTVSKIFQSGITPSALELMEKSAIKAAENQLGKKFPNSEAEAQLLIEVDGNYEDTLDRDIEKISETVTECGAYDIIFAEDNLKMNEIWALRRCIGEAVKSISEYKEEDTVVPRAKIPELINGVKRISSKYGITTICYGHAGDGNVHVNILKDKMDGKEWEENLDTAIREIFKLTVSLGGTISGEHGIGYSQKSYLPIAVGETELNLMKNIKKTMDPKNIMNPGKIFTDLS
ncbi:MAG TPA: FAD-linked oxidase C-terminal domain-containing protein [Ignavibacteria bacterium]|nr:FAD-binding oxidoreductase [Bacteroidota bacterium]HRI84820.1 FAD-linked oxidase C-terminal domain-containing protein [Ignavibacteria bacterium]HRK00530.1 FAD-linked oxidase C-terminal domain-containing protein [Ignavibacteria bacterium]